MGKNKFTFYAVARGRKVGLFSTWDECKTHVNGFNGAKYRGFHSKEDAQRYETRLNFGCAGHPEIVLMEYLSTKSFIFVLWQIY